jgi:hypothetical protein
MKKKQEHPPLRVPPGGGRVKAGNKALPGGNKKRVVVFAGAGVLLLVLGAWFLLRPRPVWYVEESFAASWARVVRDPAVPFKKIAPLPPAGEDRERLYGFLITRNPEPWLRDENPAAPRETGGTELPELELRAGGPVRVYPWLSQTREWKGALALAADPWIVFYKRDTPVLGWNRAASLEGGPGILILPGGDSAAVESWTAQFVQENPGIFPQDPLVWTAAEENLFQGRRFQAGAVTCRWLDVWPLFFRDEPAWVYAPISRIRDLPSYRMGLLEGARFPDRPDWTQFGVQAEVLWAVPVGRAQEGAGLAAAAQWLKAPRTQAEIANTINWVPAHPAGVPFNSLTWEAQLAWITSSFIWQGAEHAQQTDS